MLGHILNIGGDSLRPLLVYSGNCYPLFVLFLKLGQSFCRYSGWERASNSSQFRC